MGVTTTPQPQVRNEQDELVFDLFRSLGYMEAKLDPLGYHAPIEQPELKIAGTAAEEARRYYCGAIGIEFMHITDPERRRWIQDRFERDPEPVDQKRILEQLIRADLFEQLMQTRYLGAKRYSLEGLTALIPLLSELLDGAAAQGAESVTLAMAHRGRLNVLAHTVGRDPAEIFANFEDPDPEKFFGSGDVKYHLGATGERVARNGKTLRMHLVSNPSHLEAVDPVALGRVRAKQVRAGREGERRFVPIQMHGDAAFAGQGIVAETLNFAGVRGYTVGGTIHIITNNLIGFTTNPRELHSSRFSSDLAKRLPIPIIHVNAEDPDAVVRMAKLAIDYRYAFGSDVLIDLIGYRRHGHSEVDDPTITQPVLYKRIKEHPPLWEIYNERSGVDSAKMLEQIRAELDDAHKRGGAYKKKPVLRVLPHYWDKFKGGRWKPEYEVSTGIPAEELRELGEAIAREPQGFNVHPKIHRLMEERRRMARGEKALDYGMAEALAFASLLKSGMHVRLTGEDVRRGTFNQRHSLLVDTETEEHYEPLANLAPDQGKFEAINTILSEEAVLGFEYGYSRDYPDALVLWEAQFGDFANGGQVIIDQFISAGEDKWDLLSGLVMLLPHGYEGQGPEHSSARIERYLQLCAEDNMIVAQPSTAAQYFHLLRRQALTPWRKPLVVFTPKSMLRHPAAASPLAELARDKFLRVIPDATVQDADRVLIATGKIGHELRQERQQRKDDRTAVIMLEQMYPFPEQELVAALAQHPNARDLVWVQEEPSNMGPLPFVVPELRRVSRDRPVRSIKRKESASPATGSHKAHEIEQKALLSMAFAR